MRYDTRGPIGARGSRHYIGIMRQILASRTFGIVILLAALLGLLVASLTYAYGIWTTLGAADLPLSVILAMIGGILFSLLVGGGLMALVFYSSRHGYDERAHGRED